MRIITRILLLLIFVVPLLWLWPHRGVTVKFHPNTEWLNPTLVRAEPQINLDFMAAQPHPLPQENFSVEWTGWLRTDIDGRYAFTTRSHDGFSTIDIDDARVVDNGGDTTTATVEMTRGLHQIRLRFLQTDGPFEFYAYWTPPGAANPTTLPAQQLFVSRPPALVAYLTRDVLSVWAACWIALALVVAARVVRARRRHDISSADVREFVLRSTLVVASLVVALVAAEGMLRVGRYLREDRRSFDEQLRSAQAQGQQGQQGTQAAPATQGASSMQSLRFGEIVQPSRYPGIVYELKPNVRGRFEDQPLVINSRGIREYEYDPRKAPGTFRIVGLGDSSLFGWGVPMEDGGLKVLERRLNEQFAPRKFEVINCAVPGYNTAMEAETFVRRCAEFEPDLVILNFNTNDYDVPDFMRPPSDVSTLRRSYLFDLVYSLYLSVTGTEQQLVLFDFKRTIGDNQAARLDEDPEMPEEYRYMVGSKGVVRALEKLVAATRERGIPLLVFDVKAYPGLDPTYKRDELRDGQRELLEQESRRLGFHFMNTYQYFMDYLKQHPDADGRTVFAVSREDGHPNKLAHSINAGALLDYLIAHQLLSGDTGESAR